jgi:ribose/xylose/arabinose/galactoside ABC-type transport system permease subunit
MTTEPVPASATISRTSRWRSRTFRPENATVLLLIAGLIGITIYFTAKDSTFFTWQTVKTTSSNWADLAVLAVPMALLMIAAGVDLSLGANMALTSTLLAMAATTWGWSGWAAIGFALAIGALVGAVNGFLCSIVGCNPVIVTIGGFFALRALGKLIRVEPISPLGRGKDADGLDQSDAIFRTIGSGDFLGLPVLAWIAIGVFVLGGIFIAFTPWGRYIYAIGINPQAAYLSGLPVKALPFFLYVATGLGAAIAGVMSSAIVQSSDPSAIGDKREFYTLIVVLLGGVAWAGGRGKLSGVAVAVVFLAVLFQGLTFLNVNSFVQDVILGLALVVAAVVDALLGVLPERLNARRRIAEQTAASTTSPA